GIQAFGESTNMGGGAVRRAEVAYREGEIVREGVDDVLLRRVLRSHCIDSGQVFGKTHAFEVGPVALGPALHVRAAAERVAHNRAGIGVAGDLYIIVDADPDVLGDLHLRRVAAGLRGAFGDALPAP